MVFKVAFIDVLGLNYDGSTLTKRGLGGSESAVIQLSRELVKIGFEVTVFNDCVSDDSKPGVYDGVNYKPLSEAEFDNSYHIVISSRTVAPFDPEQKSNKYKTALPLPDFTHIVERAKWRVLWMHDTFCDGDDLIEQLCISGRINEVFVLSDFHLSYVTNCAHGRRRMFEVLKHHMFMTRNGITQYRNDIDIKAKDPNLFVYNASVTKGMIPLVTKVWPEIVKHIPEAKLTVIGGYYRFRSSSQPDDQEIKWRRLVERHKDTINFTGIIKQEEVADILSKASYMIYPAAFPETFGISTLEALSYNVPIITCDFGALEETAIDIASYKIPYPIESNNLFPHIDDEQQVKAFIDTVLIAHRDKYLHQQLMYACNQVKGINTWDTVALQWKQHFCHVLEAPMPVEEYRKVTVINHKVREVFNRRFINKEELIVPHSGVEYPIKIITPVYNAENYISKTILSIAQQDYDNYKVYLIDDASTDNTRGAADSILEVLPHNIRDKFVRYNNEVNQGAIHNQASILETLIGDDPCIVMLIDGDDWLDWDPQIFKKFSNVYKQGAQFTYGSCWSVVDNIPLIAQPYPDHIKQAKTYTQHKFNWNIPYTHLRTFRSDLIDASLFKALKDSDGRYLRAGGDVALFYELIERADPDSVICIPDIVYHYNDANPNCDFRVNEVEQNKTAQAVIARKSSFPSGLFDLRPK